MSVEAADEQPRALAEGETEAVTIAFAGERAELCGIARVGRALTDGVLRTSGLGLMFAGGSPVAVRAQSGLPDPDSGAWGDAAVAGVETTVDEPLRRWSVTFASDDGEHGFDLELGALSAPGSVEPASPVARLGGMQGYDQLVSVSGSVTVAGDDRRFRGRGQRSRAWGAPDWSRLTLARTIGVWMEGAGGVAVTALRPDSAAEHGDETVQAMLLGDMPGADGPSLVAEPRISTTYDGDGLQRQAGLELYLNGDDDGALRIAGEVACGTTLDLGDLRLQCAFFNWRMSGRSGVGRYDLLVRSDRA